MMRQLLFAVYVPAAKDVRGFVRLGGTRVMIENTLKGTVWGNAETLKSRLKGMEWQNG